MHSRGRLESIAAADGRHFEMQRRMFRMAAFIDHILRGLMFRPNRHQRRAGCMVFAKMFGQTALAVMNFDHGTTP